jgi:ATP-binding cassette subfamily B protein
VWLLGVVPEPDPHRGAARRRARRRLGRLTLGGLVAFVSYVLLLVFPLELLAWIMALAGEAESAAARVYEVFDTEPAVKDRPRRPGADGRARPHPARGGRLPVPRR